MNKDFAKENAIIAEYLKNSELANGEEKTIQLDKTGNTYKVRMVVKEEIKDEINKDEDYLTFGGLLASEISTDVFK